MPKYKYTAVDEQGLSTKGTLFAANIAEFYSMLKQNGEYCLSVQEIKDDDRNNVGGGSSLNMKDLSVLCKQFSTMLGAGITIVKSLDVLYHQQEKDKLKQILLKVYEQVQVGKSLSKALQSADGAFPNFMISMVEAGEMSGSIDQVMERLAEHYEKQVKLKNKVSSAMIYPIILCIVGLAVVFGLFVFVMPNLMGMFGDPEDLPGLTRGLMKISEILQHSWYLVLAGIAGVVVGLTILRKTKFFGRIIDKVLIFMPAVGKLYVKIMSASFCRTMYSVFSSGMSLLTSLELTTNVVGNSYVTAKMNEVMDEIRAGGALSTSLTKTEIFPQMMLTMINVGEESGALDEILAKTADFYDLEADDAIQKLVSMMEPVMIVVLGGLVGAVVIGIMLPIYGMYENVETGGAV